MRAPVLLCLACAHSARSVPFISTLSAQWAVDLSRWSDYFLAPATPGNNNGRQFYNADPSKTSYYDENLGALVLPIIPKSSHPGYAYSTAWLQSIKTFGAGRLNVRAQMPKGMGAWPAVWFLPQDQLNGVAPCRYKADYTGECKWPVVGEMDVFETVNGHRTDPNVYQDLHLGKAHTGMDMSRSEISGLAQRSPEWWDVPHDFGFHRNDSVLEWLLDGEVTHSVSADTVYGYTTDQYVHNRPASYGDNKMAPFDSSNEFNLVINIAVGGAWPCAELPGTQCVGDDATLIAGSSLNYGGHNMTIWSVTFDHE